MNGPQFQTRWEQVESVAEVAGSAFSRERETSSSEIRREEPVIAMHSE